MSEAVKMEIKHKRTIKELDKLLKRIERRLLDESPVLYYLYKHLRIVYYPDDEDNIASTDGKTLNLYGKFAKLSWKYAYYVIKHELGHVVFKHPIRVVKILQRYGEQSLVICNICADAIVNNRIIHDNVEAEKYLLRWEEYLSREDIEKLTLEELVKKFIDKNVVVVKVGGIGQDIKPNKNATGESNGGHVIQEGDEELTGSNNPEEVEKKIDEILGRAISSNKMAGRGFGAIAREYRYGSFKEHIDWYRLLYHVISSYKAKTYISTWRKMNRKNSEYAGFKRIGVVRIFACVDTSGSIDDIELGAFINELKNVIRYVDKMYVIWWNDDIAGVDVVKNKKDVKMSKPHGYGGTYFVPVIEKLANHFHVSDTDIVIVLTDGEWFDTDKTSEALDKLKGYKVLVTTGKVIDKFDIVIKVSL